MRNKGITLIVLVLTIIILIILAGISISSLTGKNGVLKNAKMAKEMSEVSSEKEAIQLNLTYANMENELGKSSKYYIGEPLYDKTLENGEKWNLVVNSKTLEKYGTGWNYILKDTEIPNYGKTKYEWVVNYDNGDIRQINSNYTVLSYQSSLAVTDSLALNIDATNLEDDNWGDIIKHGDVSYSKEKKALYFDGDGDYLELSKNADFSDGFTFEIYANLERLRYDNGSEWKCLGLFCKIPDLKNSYAKAMRFGYASDQMIGRFYPMSSWYGAGDKLYTQNNGNICADECGYEENQDFYLTFIYRKYNSENPEWGEVADKVEYYINGDLYGYTYYGIDSYNEGCKSWNKSDAHFYLGVCPLWSDGNLYYLKGNVYCTRLYEKALSPNEVNENVKKTKLYRQIN